jgi:hypothetical protein
VRYLSDEWIESLDAAARAHDGVRAAARTEVVVIQQTVTTDGDPVTYAICAEDDEVRVRAGAAAAPTITFTTDLDTAAAIAQGKGSAQVAFMDGRRRGGGDLRALLEHEPLLAALDEAFAPVRDRTEWPDPAPGAA